MTEPVSEQGENPEADPEMDHMEAVRQLRLAANEKRKKAGEIYGELIRSIRYEASQEAQPYADAFFAAVIPIVEKQHELEAEATRVYREVLRQADTEAEEAARELRLRHEALQRSWQQNRPSCDRCGSISIVDGKCMRCPEVPLPVKKPARSTRGRVRS